MAEQTMFKVGDVVELFKDRKVTQVAEKELGEDPFVVASIEAAVPFCGCGGSRASSDDCRVWTQPRLNRC